MSSITPTMSARDWGALLTLAGMWGGSFLFVAVGLNVLQPLSLGAGRVFVGAIFLLIVLRASAVHWPRDPAVWRAFLVMGFLNNVIPFTLIAWAQLRLPSGVASILNAATPFCTVIVAHFFTADEKATLPKLLGVTLGFLGVAVLIGAAWSGGDALAELAVLLATVSYACAGVFGRRFGRAGVAPLATACGQTVAAALMMVPLALLIDRPWAGPAMTWPVAGSVLGLGVLSSGLAYVLYFRLLARAGATNLLLVTLLIPPAAMLLGWAFLGERLAPHHLLGLALIGLGLSVIDGRLWRRFWARPSVPRAEV